MPHPAPTTLTPYADLLDLRHLGLVDLVVLALVVLTVVGSLRARRGVLATAGSVLGTLVVAWLATVAITLWGPSGLAHSVHTSAFGQALPTPHHAIDELHRLDDGSGRG